MIVYKIRRKSDGKFSIGGARPSFTKKGKIWKQKNHLTSHFNQLDAASRVLYKLECEIIPYELIEQPCGPALSIQQYMDEVQGRKDKRRADAKAVRDAYRKEQRRVAYEQLKQEFEK